MNNKLDIYNSILEECEAIVIEKEFTSRISEIEAYHELGTKILEAEKLGCDLNKLIKDLKSAIRKNEKTIKLAIKFATKYPDLSVVNFGKNASWSFIKNNFLIEKDIEELPALPDTDKLKEIIISNLDWLIETSKQNKKGINLFLPYERI